MTAPLDPFEGRPTAAAWGPRSIFAQQGADHHRMRKLVLPLLGGRAVRSHREIVADVAGRTVDGFPAGTPFELLPLLWEALLEIALRALLGLDRRRLEVWRPLVRELLNVALTEELMVRFALRGLGAIRLWPSAQRLRARCVRLVRGEIARRHDGDTGDDVLSLLMASRTAEGWRLNDEALVDQVLTMLLAGHTTTALGVAWAVERLVRHPPALHRLTAEALRGEDDRFATAVACEPLRLRPSTSTVPLGVARERLTFGGYRVEPGTNLLVAPRDPFRRRSARRGDEPRGGRVRGVVHAAMEPDSGDLLRLDPARLARVLGCKTAGALVLERLTEGRELELFWLFSSVSGTYGGAPVRVRGRQRLPGRPGPAAARPWPARARHRVGHDRRRGVRRPPRHRGGVRPQRLPAHDVRGGTDGGRGSIAAGVEAGAVSRYDWTRCRAALKAGADVATRLSRLID
jgi:hypothetical protein